MSILVAGGGIEPPKEYLLRQKNRHVQSPVGIKRTGALPNWGGCEPLEVGKKRPLSKLLGKGLSVFASIFFNFRISPIHN